MNNAEAGQLYFVMQSLDPYAKKRDEDETLAIVVQIAAILPKTPLDWAVAFIHQQVRGGTMPKLMDISAAWADEAERRIRAVPVPSAPPEIEDDPGKWREWERLRRDALVRGANASQALRHATQQIGGAAAVRQIESGGPPVAVSAKQDVLRKVREWTERQKAAQQEWNQDVNGGEQQ